MGCAVFRTPLHRAVIIDLTGRVTGSDGGGGGERERRRNGGKQRRE